MCYLFGEGDIGVDEPDGFKKLGKPVGDYVVGQLEVGELGGKLFVEGVESDIGQVLHEEVVGDCVNLVADNEGGLLLGIAIALELPDITF